jgi:5-methylcytosine-specific restriction enzyme A
MSYHQFTSEERYALPALRRRFTFAGPATAAKVVRGVSPVKVIWTVFGGGAMPPLPEELPTSRSYAEGAGKEVVVNAYERNPAARAACLRHYGYACSVCELKMEALYGRLGRKYIHVHHIVPLFRVRGRYKVDPIADLRPVCPNCHAMLHRQKPPLRISVLRKLLRNLV